MPDVFRLRHLAALFNAGDVGVGAGIDGVGWKEAERWRQCCRENGEQVAPLFLFGCANMTKRSMLVIPRAHPRFNYNIVSNMYRSVTTGSNRLLSVRNKYTI